MAKFSSKNEARADKAGTKAKIPVTWLPGARFAWVGDVFAPSRGTLVGLAIGLAAFWALSRYGPQCKSAEDEGNLKTAYFGHIRVCKDGKWAEVRLKSDALVSK